MVRAARRANRGRAGSPSRTLRLIPVLCLPLLLIALVPVWRSARVAESRVEGRLDWHDDGVWLAGDPHVHNVLVPSKGPTILEMAERQGLDFVASTDHAQHAFDAQSEDTLGRLRLLHPDLIVLAGIEWNVPAGDHATVVLEQTPGELGFLREFGRRFDRKIEPTLLAKRPLRGEASWGELERAVEALRWLESESEAGGPASAVYLNHVCRKDLLDEAAIERLHDAGLAGVEAAPGHQKRAHPGEHCTIDRNDPFVTVGDGYDRLAATERHYGLTAGSDFHHPRSAYFPGEFSRTLVYAPERSARGVIRGLRAGATVTVLGQIADSVVTALVAEDGTTAKIGETLVVPAGTRVRYRIDLSVPRLDFRGQPNRVDRLEIVSDATGEPNRVWIFGDIEPGTVSLGVDLPPEATAQPGSLFVRAIGRRFVGGPGDDRRNADFQFHTSSTRIRVIERRKDTGLLAALWPWN